MVASLDFGVCGGCLPGFPLQKIHEFSEAGNIFILASINIFADKPK
jgi:hypothetical protein